MAGAAERKGGAGLSDRTFILGVGAQKAGTSWLHAYLGRFDHVDTGMCKEYHVWDHVYVPGLGKGAPPPAGAARRPAQQLRLEMQRDPERYFDYFADLLARPGIRITADITPSYAALPAEALAGIHAGFARRGIACRVVFMMRDPVQRCWSMARMNHARRKSPNVDLSDDPNPQEVLRRIYRTPRCEMRTRYDRSLRGLEQGIPAEDLHVCFYEALFGEAGEEPAELRTLAAWLGLPLRPDILKQRVNGHSGSAALDPGLAREVACHYREVYSVCADRFPRSRQLWRRGWELLDAA